MREYENKLLRPDDAFGILSSQSDHWLCISKLSILKSTSILSNYYNGVKI